MSRFVSVESVIIIFSHEYRSDDNVIGALSSGASASVKIVATVVVNLIAFIATLHFLNAVLTWFGDRVGIEELTFQVHVLLKVYCPDRTWRFYASFNVQ